MDKKRLKSKKSGGSGGDRRRGRLGWWVTLMVMLGIRHRPDQQTSSAATKIKKAKQCSEMSTGARRIRFPGHISFSGRNKMKVHPETAGLFPLPRSVRPGKIDNSTTRGENLAPVTPDSDLFPTAGTPIIWETLHSNGSLSSSFSDQNACNVGELALQAQAGIQKYETTTAISADLNEAVSLGESTFGGNLSCEEEIVDPPSLAENERESGLSDEVGVAVSDGDYGADIPIVSKSYVKVKRNSVELYDPEDEDDKSLPEDPMLPKKESWKLSNLRVQNWAGKARRCWLNPDKIEEFSFPQPFVTVDLSNQPLQDPETHKMMNSLITFSTTSSWIECSDDSDTFDSEHIEDLEAMINEPEEEEDSLQLENLKLLNYVPSLSGDSSEEDENMIDLSEDQLNEPLICFESLPTTTAEVDARHEFGVADEVGARSGKYVPSAPRTTCPSFSSEVYFVMEPKSLDPRESGSETDAFSEHSEVWSPESFLNDKSESEVTDPILDKPEDEAQACSEKLVSKEGNMAGSSSIESVQHEATPSILTLEEPEVPELSLTNFAEDEQPWHVLAVPTDDSGEEHLVATPNASEMKIKGGEKKKMGFLSHVRRRCTRVVRVIRSLSNLRSQRKVYPEAMSSQDNEDNVGPCDNPVAGKEKGSTGKASKSKASK